MRVVHRVFLGIAVFFAVLALSLLAMNHFMPSEEPTIPQNNNQGNNSPQTFNIGDKVKIGNYHITVKDAYISEGGEFLSPDEGEKWVVVDVELENLSNQPQAVSSLLMFALYDQDNYKCDYALNIDSRGSLDGDIGPGRKIAGEITFSAPKNHTKFEFIFTPDLLTGGQAVFSIEP